MRQIPFGLVALLVLGLASIASAAPIYRIDRSTDECQPIGRADLTRDLCLHAAIQRDADQLHVHGCARTIRGTFRTWKATD